MSSVASKAMTESTILTGPRPMDPPGPTPSKLDKHFDFLEWCPDGDVLLLGTSALTSRSWGGSIWLFNREGSKCAENVEGWHPQASECLVGASMDCGVTVGRFLRCPDKLVVGCDSGAIQVISLSRTFSSNGESPSRAKLEAQGSLSEHNDTILDMDILGGEGLNVVTCSQDKSVKVWDLDFLISKLTFAPAHGHIVTSVRGCPLQTSIFASCSLDGSALLWDIREEYPASSLNNPCGVGLTSLSWLDESSVVFGGVDGQLTVIDTRNTGQPKFKLQLERRPVHSIKSGPTLTGLVAVCQDNSSISVVECCAEGLESIYTSDRHGDMVRGLSWDPKNPSLWSCGWDSKVMAHHFQHGGGK